MIEKRDSNCEVNTMGYVVAALVVLLPGYGMAAGDEVTILSAQLDMMTWGLAGVGLLGCIGIGVAILATSRKYLIKYAELSAAMDAVSTGRTDIVLQESGSDNIGKMSGGLNRVVRHIVALEAKVAECEHAVRMADDKTCAALDQACQAREQGEAARCHGLLSAAETLDVSVQGIRDESMRLDVASSRARNGAADQQRYITDAVSAMEQMNAAVSETAMNAEAAAGDADQAMQYARNGALVVTRTLESISAVSGNSQSLAVRVASLGSQAEGVGTIMGVISDIADQTNLLALNAAIEAARAGEAGRGFAVVADEVRKLAEKTMEATRDVGVAIEGIQEQVARTIEGVQEMTGLADSAAGLANESGEALEEIVTYAGHSADRIRSIASAASQQSLASEEVTRTITEVHAISQETDEGMEEASQAVKLLAERVEDLSTMTGVFRLVGNGKVQDVIGDLAASMEIQSMDRSRQEQAMRQALRRSDFLELLYITDHNGLQLVSNMGGKVTDFAEDRSAYGSNWASRPWFTGVVETRTFNISDVYVSSASGENCITVSGPFFDDGGQVKGVIAADVRVSV